MGGNLFQRRPIPVACLQSQGAAHDEPAAATPMQVETGIAVLAAEEAPFDGAVPSSEPAHSAAAPPVGGLATDLLSADLHSDFPDIGAGIERARAFPSPYDQLICLSDLYRELMLCGWQRHVAAVEVAGANLGAALAASRAPVLAAYDARIAALGTDLEKSAEDVAAQVSALRLEHGEFVKQSASLVGDVWRRIGLALNIPEPGPVVPIESMGAGAGVLPDSGYDIWAGRARELPEIGAFTDDPAIRKRLPWFAGAALIFGTMSFGSFSGGLFTAVWVAAGVLIWVHWRRTEAKRIFDSLVDLTGVEQGRRAASMEARIADLQQRTSAATARREEGRRAAQSQRDKDLAAIDASFEGPLTETRRMWEDGRSAFAGHISTWAKSIEAAIAQQPARLDAWQACPGPDDPEPALADQLRIRLGGEDLLLPVVLDEATAALVGSSSFATSLPGPRPPLFFDLGRKRSMLVYDDRPAGMGASDILASVIARMLTQLPPGKLNLTLFDPVGLGRNYSAFLKLSDYSDLLISGKVWSEREHVRRKLKELIEHIETVTQKYLRADFPDIETYNAKAEEIAEAYKILVISDFPEGFDEESTKDLIRIIQNGARCGVFALIHVNRSAPMPYGVDLASLEPFCVRLGAGTGDAHLMVENPGIGAEQSVFLDGAPPADLLDEIVRSFGERTKTAKRVEVPYRRLLEIAGIGDDQWWTRSAEAGFEAPLGPTGANKAQLMRLGSGLAHHALLVGRPGSGKSNLIHVFISTLARLYSPDEIELYLVDFKKGVEFKAYAEASLPHARVIAVESEREFGLSVLQGLDAELKRRGEVFRKAGTASFSEYRQKANGKKPGQQKAGEGFPRIILIVDEFQEFFSRDDRIGREAAVLFDRLVRQGRAFGIHLVLGTQSLANAGLQKATQDQMAVRIALQCSEADSRLILAEDNLFARGLTRPGEAIYNDAAGLIEGNNQFQVALFSEADRNRELAAISKTALRKKWKGAPPVIFEGHEPADISLSSPLQNAGPLAPGQKLEMWLGEPTALRPPVAATLRRQSARNMLILTRDEEQGTAVVLASLCAIAAQSAPADAQFQIIDLTAADAAWADHPEAFAEAVPHQAEVLGKRDVRTLLPELQDLIEQRTERGASSEPTIILAIIGLHRARDLRTDEMGAMSLSFDAEPSVNLSQCFEKILQDGPEVGVHTIVWCDSFGNLDRVVDRGGLNEIGLRVSGPLSPADSHRLFDDDVAAGIDKPHRLVKFDDEQVGVFELFRPYALPSAAFFQAFGATLRKPGHSAAKPETNNG